MNDHGPRSQMTTEDFNINFNFNFFILVIDVHPQEVETIFHCKGLGACINKTNEGHTVMKTWQPVPQSSQEWEGAVPSSWGLCTSVEAVEISKKIRFSLQGYLKLIVSLSFFGVFWIPWT
jgi:hypothetical protein